MPHYPGGKHGRPPKGREQMLRMHLLQVCFDLSDEGTEDAALVKSYAEELSRMLLEAKK